MATIRLGDGTLLGDFRKPYIVAELNTSHFGSIENAKRMIDEAAKTGCDCVKFQSWSADSLYSKTFYSRNPIAKRMFEKFALSEVELAEVAKHCRVRGIGFASTPYSRSEVSFLIEKCDVPYIKVASMDLNHLQFLEYIAKTGRPIVLSTGMGELEEIRKAVSTIEKAGNDRLAILHCISIYPPEIPTINLRNILGLREEFPRYPIGFSDHSSGIELACAAVALGACLIEKHFTLDRSKIGLDNQMATEPEEFARLARGCRNVQSALGDIKRTVLPSELEQRAKMRRSIIAAHDLRAGARLTLEDLDAKRPGTGIPPERIEELLGRTLARDVPGDTLISMDDLSQVPSNP